MYLERHSSIALIVFFDLLAFACGWWDFVIILCYTNLMQKLQSKLDMKFATWSLCKLTGQLSLTIPCSTKALATVLLLDLVKLLLQTIYPNEVQKAGILSFSNHAV